MGQKGTPFLYVTAHISEAGEDWGLGYTLTQPSLDRALDHHLKGPLCNAPTWSQAPHQESLMWSGGSPAAVFTWQMGSGYLEDPLPSCQDAAPMAWPSLQKFPSGRPGSPLLNFSSQESPWQGSRRTRHQASRASGGRGCWRGGHVCKEHNTQTPQTDKLY